MNIEDDFGSENDQSDEDFCPNSYQSDVASEDESEDISDDNDPNESEDITKRKRSSKAKSKTNGNKTKGRRGKKIKSKTEEDNVAESEEFVKYENGGRRLSRRGESEDSKKAIEKDEIESDEEDKSRKDALWADFLSDVKTPTPSPSPTTTKKPTSAIETKVKKTLNEVSTPSTIENKSKSINKNSNDLEQDSKEEESSNSKMTIETEIVEFAGEEVTIQRTARADIVKENESLSSKPVAPKANPLKRAPALGKSSGGLGALMSQIGKKKKISVLEKTKLDWNSFKQTEGIQEELETHNKGKDGYLERQDFLQRTDLRQFEIERSLRQSRRKQ